MYLKNGYISEGREEINLNLFQILVPKQDVAVDSRVNKKLLGVG
jgi:hypothetical protein